MKVQSKLTVGLLCAASVMAMVSGAQAQDASSVEAVTVTGSRVISDIQNSPTPLTVVTSEQLLQTTPTNIPDALNKLPVFAGSSTQRSAFNASANSAANTLNLRNFGVQRTLVLLDGHRNVAAGQNGAVDIDSLPQMMMSRVDVVTGGASAVYGSDAITGVVNFVLDKKFDGIKYDANAGISGRGLAANYQVGVAGGTSLFGGRGHIEGSVRMFSEDPVLIMDLPYGPKVFATTGNSLSPTNPVVQSVNVRSAAPVTGLVTGCGTGCAAANMQFTAPGVLGGYNPGNATGSVGVSSGGDGGYAIHTNAQTELKTYQSFLRASYDLNDSTTVYVQGSASQSTNRNNYYDMPFISGITPVTYFKNNPYLSASAQSLLNTGTGTTFTSNKTASELLPEINRGVDRTLQATVGADGTLFGKYDWDLFYSHGENRLSELNINNPNNQKLTAAQDAVLNASGQVVCYDTTPAAGAAANAAYAGCIPLNPFGANISSLSSEQYWADTTFFRETNTLDNLGGSISGEVFDLPAGPVKAALSGEARWTGLKIDSPAGPPSLTVNCAGLRLCPARPGPLYSNSVLAPVPLVTESVWEFALEANAPLLKDLPLIQALDVNVAGRYTDYSASGAVQTWKVGIDYHVDDNIRFRGTTSVDIRSPTLTDLYGPLQASAGGFVDAHTGNINGFPLIQSNPSNANLVPEIARTYTVGVVLTPEFIPGLTASVDWYQIHMSNAITTVTSATAQTFCEASAPAYTSPYCSYFTRPLPYTNTTPANYPTFVAQGLVNAAFLGISGIDVEVDYRFDLADVMAGLPGSFSVRELFSNQPVNETQALPGQPFTFTAQPKARSTTFLSYTVGDWSLNLQDQWISGYKLQTTAAPQYYNLARVKAFNSLDVTIDRKMDLAGGEADLFLSIGNITNNNGPLYGGYAGTPGFSYPVPAGYPILGRTFSVGLKGNL